jgi:UPF0042 nucleotide-binding protein
VTHVVLVLGPTGSGRSTALDGLREAGFAVLDTRSTSPTTELFSPRRQLPERVAVALDADDVGGLAALPDAIDTARARGARVDVVVLDADDATLMARAARLGLAPPLAAYGLVSVGLAAQRDRVAKLGELITHRVDTTGLDEDVLVQLMAMAFGTPRIED